MELIDEHDAQCEHCGAKLVVYQHSLNNGLGVVLALLYRAGVPTCTSSLDLTIGQRTNATKLKYWGLADMYVTEETKRKRGWLVITDHGRQFVRGGVAVPRSVFVKRDQVVRVSDDMIAFSELKAGYKFVQDYADEAAAQLVDGETGQTPLFTF